MPPESSLLICNRSTRIHSRDMFMLMALWMEKYPRRIPVTSHAVRPTGCVLVDARDRVVALECTGEAHAIVRAILKCAQNTQGCDIYVSRFPCALCTKLMVQAGIRKIYYFPADKSEMDWEIHCSRLLGIDPNQSVTNTEVLSSSLSKSPVSLLHDSPTSTRGVKRTSGDSVDKPPLSPNKKHSMGSPHLYSTEMSSLVSTDIHSLNQGPSKSVKIMSKYTNLSLESVISEKKESNYRSVQRLITNNAVGMTIYIPQWEPPTSQDMFSPSVSESGKTAYATDDEVMWKLDGGIATMPTLSSRWPIIHEKFQHTMRAISLLHKRYADARLNRPNLSQKLPQQTTKLLDNTTDERRNRVLQHAMVLAHIAARRTDDPKVGVGAVLVSPAGQYESVGWNGFPEKAANLDYPQAGADDLVDEEELKYDYILHAGKSKFVSLPDC